MLNCKYIYYSLKERNVFLSILRFVKMFALGISTDTILDRTIINEHNQVYQNLGIKNYSSFKKIIIDTL